MKIAKSVVAGLVVATSLALVAACGDSGGTSTNGAASSAPSTAATSGKAVSATERLTTALTKTSAATHKFSVNFGEGTFAGSVDPAAGVTIGKITITDQGTTLTIDSMITATAYYMKLSGLPLPGLDGSKWYKADPKKVTSNTLVSFGETSDPTGLKIIAGDLTSVESADGKQFKGTLDVTKKPWGPVDKSTVASLGDKAKAVPFEATVDDKGNLTSIKVSQPAANDVKATDYAVTYSDFGAPVAAQTPAAASVIDAPETIYSLLNTE